MGLFLAMSSVVGAKPPEVEACVAKYVASRGGTFERASSGLSEDQEARLLESQGGVTLVYPDRFIEWDELSAKLSADLKKPTFSFHIHDGDLWMFVLFVNGEEAVKFNPIPDYWEELKADERAKWLPTPDQVARHVPGVRSERLASYLVEWPEDGLPGKARPEDQFEFIDWQVVDFMRELGFRYPDPGQGFSYQFKVKRRR
ncbi:MAG TPA: hypothetical protein VIL86_21035 [Tepidisphaeraceae bacterium]